MVSANNLKVSLLTMPFGILSRIMNRPGVRRNLDKMPVHLSREFMSKSSISE